MIRTNDRDTLLRQLHNRLAQEMAWQYGHNAELHDMIEYLLLHIEPMWLLPGKAKASGRFNPKTIATGLKLVWVQWFRDTFNKDPQRSTITRIYHMSLNATNQFQKDLTGYMKDGMTAKPIKAKEI